MNPKNGILGFNEYLGEVVTEQLPTFGHLQYLTFSKINTCQ